MAAGRDDELQRIQRDLATRVPWLGQRLRKRALRRLVALATPQAVRLLAETAIDHPEPTTRDAAEEALHQLNPSQPAIDRLAHLWDETRHPRLRQLIQNRGFFATHPPRLALLTRLLSHGEHAVTDIEPAQLPDLLAIAEQDPDPALAATAQSALRRLSRPDTQRAVCDLVLQNEQPSAAAAAIAGDYQPEQPGPRAVFWFLTRQWERYEALDFDQSLLRSAYETGDVELRRRIAERARQAGHAAWVHVVAGGRHHRRLGAMNDLEWQAALDVLTRRQQWPDLWRLAQSAPPRQAIRQLQQLHDAGWQPSGPEASGFHELRDLAIGLTGDVSYGLFEVGELPGSASPVSCMAISAKATWLALGDASGTISLHRWSEPQRLITIPGHRDAVTAIAFSPNGKALLTAASRDVRLWSVPEGLAIHTATLPDDLSVQAAGIRAEGRSIGVSLRGSVTEVFDVFSTGLNRARLDPLAAAGGDAAVGRAGQALAVGGGEEVRLLRLPELRLRRRYTLLHEQVSRLAFSGGGHWLLVGTDRGRAHAMRAVEADQRLELTAHDATICDLAGDAAGGVGVVAAADGGLSLWGLPGARALLRLRLDKPGPFRVALCPAAQTLITTHADGRRRLWRRPGAASLEALKDHPAAGIPNLALDERGQPAAEPDPYAPAAHRWPLLLLRLNRLPAAEATTEQLHELQHFLASVRLPELEAQRCRFIEAQQLWRRRFDVELADATPTRIELGVFDIEIEG